MATIKVVSSTDTANNIEIEVERGINLRTILIENKIEIKSPCGGCASCAQCIVVIKDGEQNLNAASFEEKQLIGNVFHLTGERLSCQTKVIGTGTVIVDVSAHDSKDTLKKSLKNSGVKTIRRTPDEAKAVIDERKARAAEKPEKQGGFKKPKAFIPSSEE